LNVRIEIGKLYNEDFLKPSYEILKEELRFLMSEYSRYQIFHNKWEGFKSKSHNLTSVIEWCNWCEQNGVNRYEWGRVK
jgi:hypothetical protein